MITVIIPVYNCENYIRRIYNCIERQSYNDWELIFVDDGSTDESSAICDSLCVKNVNDRVRVMHQINKGASVARRVGIEHARGEYIVFVDCDDIVEEDYLELLWSCLQKYAADGVKMAACDMIMHEENEVVTIDKEKSMRLLKENELQKRFFHYQFWGFGGKIYHKSVFADIYIPHHTINEDYVVMAQLFNRYKQMAYIPVALYHYMKHGDSLSHQKLSKRMFDEYYNKVWVRNFYIRNAPKWTQCAEAQLLETCVKLLRCVKQDDKAGEYDHERVMLRGHLRSHACGMLINPYLNSGVKVMALSLLL